MNHLTAREIFQIVDGTIANGEKSKLLVHLEACRRCSQEVQFQRTLGQAAKQVPLSKPSKGFTPRIIGIIASGTKKSWASRIIDNLGNILAMGMVLTVVRYAVNTAPASNNSDEPTAISNALATYVEYYAKARDAVSKEIVKVVGEPRGKEQTSKTSDVGTLTLISLLILAAIDRFVVRRMVKIRM